MRTSILCLVGAGLLLGYAEPSHAQLFRRLWERRKAEVRSELLGELSAKMDSDLAREVAAARQHLQEVADRQIREQGEALEEKVEKEVTALQKQALGIVESEAKRLETQVQAKVEEMTKQYEAQLAAVQKQYEEKLQAAVAKLQSDFESKTAAMEKSSSERVEQMTKKMQAEVEEAIARLAQAQQSSPAPPANDNKKPRETPAPNSAAKSENEGKVASDQE